MYFETATPSSMSLDDLRRLVRRGEGQFLEFKRTIPSTRKIAREIAAFANTSGGTLLVGVDDDTTIVGVEGYHEEEYLLKEAATQLCLPAVDIKIEVVPISHRDVLVVYVHESEEKPVYLKDKKGRQVYIREADKAVTASREMVEIMKNQSSEEGVTFEYGPNEQRLFQYLNEYERISVREYSNLINVNSYRASQILINLVSAGILSLLTKGSNEFYTFSPDTQ